MVWSLVKNHGCHYPMLADLEVIVGMKNPPESQSVTSLSGTWQTKGCRWYRLWSKKRMTMTKTRQTTCRWMGGTICPSMMVTTRQGVLQQPVWSRGMAQAEVGGIRRTLPTVLPVSSDRHLTLVLHFTWMTLLCLAFGTIAVLLYVLLEILLGASLVGLESRPVSKDRSHRVSTPVKGLATFYHCPKMPRTISESFEPLQETIRI